MKKTTLWLIIFAMVMSVVLVGCSDDKKSSITGGDLINFEENFDFFMGIVPWDFDDEYDKGSYWIMIESFDYNQALTSAELKIDGENIELMHQGWDIYNWFVADIDLSPGQTISFELKLNSTTYTGDLKIPYRPQNVNFPAQYDPTQSYTINWSLAQDSQYQLFDVYGESGYWDEEEWDWVVTAEDGKYKDLSPSARSFTIPANWINVNLDEYDMGLWEFSAKTSGKFIAIAIDGELAYYGEYWDKETPELQMRDKVTRIANILNK